MVVGEFSSELFGLLPCAGELEELAKMWIKSDAPDFDIGGFVVGEGEKVALLLGKSPGK